MSATKTLALTTLMLCLGAPRAWGQVIDKKTISLEGAKAVAAAAASEARRNNEGGSIAVVDDGGNLVYLERLEPTFPASAEIAIHKARTAALFQRSSKVLEDAITSGRTSLLKVLVSPGVVRVEDRALGFDRGFLVRDPDGHVVQVVAP